MVDISVQISSGVCLAHEQGSSMPHLTIRSCGIRQGERGLCLHGLRTKGEGLGEIVNYSDDTILHENVSNAFSDIYQPHQGVEDQKERGAQVERFKGLNSPLSSFHFFFLSPGGNTTIDTKMVHNFGPALTVTTLLKCSYLCV